LCPHDKYPKLEIYVSELIYVATDTSSIRKNALRYLVLNKTIVLRFVDTGNFLIRYSIDHTKSTYRQFKKLRDDF